MKEIMNMDKRDYEWNIITNRIRSHLCGKLPDFLTGTEKVISYLRTYEKLPIPTVSHGGIVYEIKDGWGLVTIEVLNSNVCQVSMFNHNFSECLFRKETNIDEFLPELEKLLINAPGLLDKYLAQKREKI